MMRLAILVFAIPLLASGCTRKATPRPAPAAAPTKAATAPAPVKAAPADAGPTAAPKAAPAAQAGAPPAKPWPQDQPRIDAPVKDFSLKDPAGRAHSLFATLGRKGAVVVFVSTRCPYATAYDGVLGKLARRYRKHGIHFLAIDANKDEPAKAVAAWRRKAHLPFPVLLDPQGAVARALGARGTPDAYLIGADHALRYHGSIGNAMRPTTDPGRADATDLEPALNSHLAGKRPVNPIVHSFGCPLHR